MIIAFFGHSNYESNLNDKELILKILNTIACGNQINFYFGGYGNFDNFALECVKEFKKTNKNAKLFFITPYINEWLNERKDILKKTYDEIIYPEIELVPKKFAILKRNEWIVLKADFVIGYVKTHYGGAYKALLYDKKHKKPYINLYKGNYLLY